MQPFNREAILRRHREIVADLESQIRATEAKLEAELAELDSRYEPASRYVPMSVTELNKARWAPVGAVVDAVRMYADIVRDPHMLEFLAEGDNRAKLVEWMRMKIGEFESVGDVKAARRYRALLARAGVEVP